MVELNFKVQNFSEIFLARNESMIKCAYVAIDELGFQEFQTDNCSTVMLDDQNTIVKPYVQVNLSKNESNELNETQNESPI
jgi:hypothetical protein